MSAGRVLRVCAYCRVSTDLPGQAGSLINQESFFRSYISGQEGWELTEIYTDEGRSGTSAAGRPAFMRMLRDAEAGAFDRIITKEISRFARNTVDTLVFVRRLKTLGIGVTFLNDGIDTLAAEGELRLTLLSSIAQEESRRTSERVRWGQKRRMEQGVVFGSSPFGYELKEGKLEVIETEAETVRLIFRLYALAGLGAAAVAKRLNEEGIPPRQAAEWSAAAVRRVISNEKYTGDLVQGKSVTEDHLTHRRVRCDDPEKLTVLHCHHPAIVSRELFEKAQRQRELRRRPAESGRYSSRYWCSGKIVCGNCGGRFVSRSKRLGDRILRSWRCQNACGQPSIRDGTLREAAASALEERGVSPGETAEIVYERLAALRRKHRSPLPSFETVLSAAESDKVLGAALERITVYIGYIIIKLWGYGELRVSIQEHNRYRRAGAHGDDLSDTLPAHQGSLGKGDKGGRL